MTPAQCRAARGLLKWNQDNLAGAAAVSSVTVRNFENEKSTPQRASLAMMQRALEDAGVEFTNGGQAGVKWKQWKWSVEILGADNSRRCYRLCPDFTSTFAAAKTLMSTLQAPERPHVHIPAEATDAERAELRKLGLSPIWP
jgi:transcriptional regulator with XRE-family HTH domain